jgi:hypothetical protein
VLPDAGQIGEAQVNHLDVGGHLQDISRGFGHGKALAFFLDWTNSSLGPAPEKRGVLSPTVPGTPDKYIGE